MFHLSKLPAYFRVYTQPFDINIARNQRKVVIRIDNATNLELVWARKESILFLVFNYPGRLFIKIFERLNEVEDNLPWLLLGKILRLGLSLKIVLDRRQLIHNVFLYFDKPKTWKLPHACRISFHPLQVFFDLLIWNRTLLASQLQRQDRLNLLNI